MADIGKTRGVGASRNAAASESNINDYDIADAEGNIQDFDISQASNNLALTLEYTALRQFIEPLLLRVI